MNFSLTFVLSFCHNLWVHVALYSSYYLQQPEVKKAKLDVQLAEKDAEEDEIPTAAGEEYIAKLEAKYALKAAQAAGQLIPAQDILQPSTAGNVKGWLIPGLTPQHKPKLDLLPGLASRPKPKLLLRPSTESSSQKDLSVASKSLLENISEKQTGNRDHTLKPTEHLEKNVQDEGKVLKLNIPRITLDKKPPVSKVSAKKQTRVEKPAKTKIKMKSKLLVKWKKPKQKPGKSPTKQSLFPTDSKPKKSTMSSVSQQKAMRLAQQRAAKQAKLLHEEMKTYVKKRPIELAHKERNTLPSEGFLVDM